MGAWYSFSVLSAGDYTVIVTGTTGSTVHSDEITFTVTSIPEFSLDIENREQIIVDGTMSISGVINAHNGLDLSLGGALDVLVEPYNQDLIDSAVITWGTIDMNGDLPFTVTFAVDDSIPRNEYTINLNVVSLDGGLAHSASVAFVTESSTLDGTAVAADASAVVSGNTSLHDGTDSSATNIASGQDKDEETSESESKSSNTGLIVGGTIGVLGVVIGVAVDIMRGRNGDNNKDFAQQMWTEQPNMATQTPVAGMSQMGQPMAQQPAYQQPVAQQPIQPAQPTYQQPVAQQPLAQSTYQQPVAQQPAQPVVQQPAQPMTAPAPPVATAPAPPAQPTTVADYTGLPPGGQYDQSTGQTIYVQTDGVRWQMMPDGSFNRL